MENKDKTHDSRFGSIFNDILEQVLKEIVHMTDKKVSKRYLDAINSLKCELTKLNQEHSAIKNRLIEVLEENNKLQKEIRVLEKKK